MNSKMLKTNKNNIIDGPLIIESYLHSDQRGYFYERWNQHKFDRIIGEKINFSQDNISRSKKGVLRGIHYQLEPNSQDKLIQCSTGEIFDVAVDLRLNSSTFGEWIYAILNDQNRKQLWIPKGFAHGFLTLSEYAEVNYKVSNQWSEVHERSIIWNDKSIGIKWPLDNLEEVDISLSIKDSKANNLKDALKLGDVFK